MNEEWLRQLLGQYNPEGYIPSLGEQQGIPSLPMGQPMPPNNYPNIPMNMMLPENAMAPRPEQPMGNVLPEATGATLQQEQPQNNWIAQALKIIIPALAAGAGGYYMGRNMGFEAPYGGTTGTKGDYGLMLGGLGEIFKKQRETAEATKKAQLEATQQDFENKMKAWDAYISGKSYESLAGYRTGQLAESAADRALREKLGLAGLETTPKDWAYINYMKGRTGIAGKKLSLPDIYKIYRKDLTSQSYGN